MISSLGINDLGVISSARIDLGPGLTVVTGETGAGKTMFVTALDLLTGARADAHVVRKDAERAVVEGVFDLTAVTPEVAERIAEAGGDVDEDEAIVTRVVPVNGRARATAGGRTVPLGVLKDVGDRLVSMHGQSEQLTLRNAATQRALLDEYGGAPVAKALETYRRAHREWKDLAAEHERLLATATERADRIAWLTSSLERIDAVRPLPGEDEELRALSVRLGAAEDLKTAVGAAHARLVGTDWDETVGVADLLAGAVAELERASALDDSLRDSVQGLTDLGIRVGDLAASLTDYLQGFEELGEMSLEETESRRAALSSLEAFGEDNAAVLAFEERAGKELLDLQNSESSLGDIAFRVEEAHTRMREAGDRLRAAREKAAGRFARAVSAELTALSMPRARIVFEITEAEESHALGTDSVRMLFSAHEASEPGDIGKLASGGELSRVMLAIEVVKASSTRFPTFVFDEVDSGVGGKAAIEIGRRLAMLAKTSQVIVVTHLAQVAAWADQHCTIVKDDRARGAVSGVTVLDRAGQEAELARMLGGMSDSDSARAHAAELLELAHRDKSQF